MRRTPPLPLLAALTLLASLLGGAPPAGAAESPADAEALLERARVELEGGDVEAAIALLEPARDWADAPAPLLAVLGGLYLESGRPEDAHAVLEPLARREDANPAVLYNAGRAAVAIGRFDDGLGYLERSVGLEPDTPAARVLGLLWGLEGRIRDAYSLLLPWARSHPEDTEVRRAAALAALQLRRASEAEELLSDLPQSDPTVRFLWGHLLLVKGDPHGAISTLRAVLGDAEAAEPLQADARRILAQAYLEVGEARSAVELLEGKVTGAGTALLLARAQHQTGEMEPAIETLRPFAEPLPTSTVDRSDPRLPLAFEILREYGRWLVSAGRAEEAIPYLRSATEIDPEEKLVWQALGQALAASERPEEARQALERFQQLAREEGPESERINQARARQEDPTASELDRAQRLMAQGLTERALEVVRGEISLAPEDLRARLLESRLLLHLERPAEALEAARQALRLAPESPDAFYQRGTAHVALGEIEPAEADLRRALQLAPDHVPALSDLAVVLLVQGERDEARRLLERVLELRPGDPQATETLARISGAAS